MSRNETQQLRKTIIFLESSKDAFSQKSEDLNRQLLESKNQLAELHQEMAAKEEKLGNLEKDRQAMIKQAGLMQEEHKETLSRIRKEKEAVEADLQGKVKILKNQLGQKEKELQTSRNEAQLLLNTITSLESSKVALSKKSEDLNRQLMASKHRLTELQQEIATKEKELVRIAEDRKARIEQVDLLEEEREKLSQKTHTLENQLEQSKRQLQAISQVVEDKEEKFGKIAEDLQALSKHVNILEGERKQLNKITQELNTQLGMSRSQIEAISQDAAAKQKRLISLKKSYEELIRQLKEQIQEKELEINTLEDKLNIRLLNKILFDPGKTVITTNGKQVLKSLAGELKKIEGIQILVEGHTDNQPLGPRSRSIYHDNLGLSVARSAAVVRALRRMGISPQFLSTSGYSKYRPVASNDTSEERQKNRRVEIVLTPLR